MESVYSSIRLLAFVIISVVAYGLAACSNDEKTFIVDENNNRRMLIVLENNYVDGVNVLTQEQFNTANALYVVKHDFVLGTNITIPSGCTLQFEGGSISGAYSVIGNNTTIISAKAVRLFGSNIIIAGTWIVPVSFPEWFDISNAGNAIQKAVNISDHVILSGEYFVHNSDYKPTGGLIAQRELIENGSWEESYIKVGGNKTIEISGTVKALSPLTDLFRVVGNNTLFCGGGIIEGCGVVNDINSDDEKLQWDASLIRIQGGNNRINSLCLYNPTTNCIFVKEKSTNTIIEKCTFGGGLPAHGQGTHLNGVYNRGDSTIVSHNRFITYDGKNLYCALFSYDLKGYSTTLPYVFKENYTEDLMDHVVYAYNNNGIIDSNIVFNCGGVPLQLFGNTNRIVNNEIEWNDANAFNPNINPDGLTCITTRKGGHYIADNKVRGVTKSFITIDDYQASVALSGDAENIIIKDNEVNICYGLYEFTSALNIGVPKGGSFKNVSIEGNVFKGTLGDKYSYYGCIDMVVDGSSEGIKFENINIINNVFDTLAGRALRLIKTNDNTEYVFKNISVINNKIINPLRNASCVSNYTIDINNCEGLRLTDNDISFTDDFTSLNPGKFVSIENSTMALVSKNKYIPHKDTNSYWINLTGTNNSIVEDNIILTSQKGVATIPSGCNTVMVEAPISIYNKHPEATVIISPINDNAISLQASSNFATVVFRLDGVYGIFNISTNDGSLVTGDCEFSYEVKYVC